MKDNIITGSGDRSKHVFVGRSGHLVLATTLSAGRARSCDVHHLGLEWCGLLSAHSLFQVCQSAQSPCCPYCSLCNKLRNLSVFIWSVFLSHELWNDEPEYLEATDESPSLPTQRDFLLAGPQRKPQAPQPHMCKAFAVDQLQMRK